VEIPQGPVKDLENKDALSLYPYTQLRTRLNESDRSALGVTTSVKLFQNPCNIAACVLGVRNVYLGGFPATVHGDGDGHEVP
jgi:hypothetical protein